MADEKIRYVLEVDDKGTTKLVKFGQTAAVAGDKASKGFNKASKAVGDFGQQLPGVGSGLSFFAGGPAVAAGAAVAALGVGFASIVSKSINMADNMNDLSLRLGVSTERLSVLSLYAEQSGTDIDTLASAMGKLGVKLSDGDKQLQSYGITATSVDEALFQLADKIAATTDPMLRLKMATDAFGKSGQQMLPLLVQGGEALRSMASEAPIVSTEMAKMADEFNDKWASVKGQFTGIGLEITNDLLPALQSAVDLVGQIVNGIKGGKGNTLQGIAMEEAKIAKLREQSNAAGISDLQRRKILSEIKNAEAGILLRAQGQLESDIGKMSSAGGMGGYRGESLTVKPTGVIGAGATVKPAKAGPAAKPGQVDYFGAMGIDATNVQFRANQTRQAQFDAAKMASGDTGTGATNEADFLGMYPDYYAGLPMTDKARESLEKQYDAEQEIAVQKAEAQQTAINNAISTIRGDLQGSFSQAFTEIWTDGRDAFDALYDAFSEKFTARVIDSLATLAANFLLPGGGTAGAGILGMLGFASGGAPPVGMPVEVGERRREVFVPQGPGRVAPTAGAGSSITINVSNPAEARSMLRGIRTDERKRNTGIR